MHHGREMIDADPQVVVVPFFRAPVLLDTEGRRLFSGLLSQDEFERRLRAASVTLRQNVSRIFAASRLAASTRARLAFVEGWRGNRILRGDRRRQKVVTGSWMSWLILRMLQRRGLTDYRGGVVRAERSRCTAEEASSVLALRQRDDRAVIGVAGSFCPSAARARRYLRLLGGGRHTALDPAAALARTVLRLGARETALLRVTEPRIHEKLTGFACEATHWAVHLMCLAIRPGGADGLAMETRLAHKLRRDA